MDDGPSLIAFRPQDAGKEIVGQLKPGGKPRRAHGLSACKCGNVYLDEDRRMIECRECGLCWEAYDWVKARVEWQLWKFSILESIQKAIIESRANLDDLEKRERNAKARVRAWEGKAELRCGLE